jgi:hypothetical protein
MVQQPTIPHDLRTDFDHHTVLFPTRSLVHAPTKLSVQSAFRPAAGARLPARAPVIPEVVVLEVAGRSGGVVEDLDRTIQLALAEGPRAVVCDLTAAGAPVEPGTVEVVAAAGRHVRDWPGIPVAVACSDARVREAVHAHPLGGHLIVAESMFSAVSAVLAAPTLAAESLGLTPRPTAPRLAREFVTRTLLGWRLGAVIPFANLIVSELVASSCISGGTDLEVSVAWDSGALRWDLGALRLSVRDHGAMRGERPSLLGLDERGLTIIAGLARAFGSLPTADGGKVAWAVINTATPRHSPALLAGGTGR